MVPRQRLPQHNSGARYTRCETSVIKFIQASVVAHESAAWSAFVRKVKHLPLVLTGENISQQQKLLGIKCGAVDFLEKPVALLKLRNVWQHTVRKVRVLSQAADVAPTPDVHVQLADCDCICACFL